MRGTPWYARRHAGPDMTMISPERNKIGIGATSRVRPPTRKIAAFPSLVMDRKLVKVIETGMMLTRLKQEGKWRKSRSGRHDPSRYLSFGKS
jgi:hypothetical protein